MLLLWITFIAKVGIIFDVWSGMQVRHNVCNKKRMNILIGTPYCQHHIPTKEMFIKVHNNYIVSSDKC